jgi:mono/diheme cytochrome c family protein
MTTALILAANFRAIGLTVAVIVLGAFVLLFIRNSFQARAELGSEIELAANKKEYFSDEDLEGKKLDWSLSFALVVMAIIALILPFYWLAEPGRQEGAVDAYQLNFESRGEGVYVNTAQCVNCHAAGGVGGVATYVLQDADGQFLANAAWVAPALNNIVHRYSTEEFIYILNYGRPGSPMAAWGTPGGGPLTEQQITNVIKYIETFQVQSLDPIEINEADDPAAAAAAAADLEATIREEVQRSLADGEFSTVGEAVFNLGYFSGFQAGSLGCGRCHTSGWSLGPQTPHPGGDPLSAGVAGCGGGNPSGIGFNLCNGSVINRFPDDWWKLPDGSWAPREGLSDDLGFYLLAMDGTRVPLNEKGVPVTSHDDSTGELEAYLVLDSGDLADCATTSKLWEPGGVSSLAYPFAADYVLEVADEDTPDDVATTNGFVDPPRLLPEDLPGEVVELGDGRLGGGCTVIDMPERTSYAHYDFIYNGANAGQGYGRGGLSAAGMMPGFGALLPEDYIQAVVDYERGL